MEAPDFLQNPQLSTSDNNMASADSFVVDDLLNFSNVDDETLLPDDASLPSLPGNSTNSSTVTAVDASPASQPNVVSDIDTRNFHDPHFSGDLCVPCRYIYASLTPFHKPILPPSPPLMPPRQPT
ncbi:uncharacterized protein LOC114757323 [Neltuma alba]|uniref:uncharacterized protein LOC114757323 n=1 Tax=Neltuma alba TaxID=207710 RepID=UPI0010A2BCF5|nr:uncharacterized protein LOC114757323 [Prosopis alba]